MSEREKSAMQRYFGDSAGKLVRHEVCPRGVSLDDIYKIPKEDRGETYWFWCPGCNTPHQYRTKAAKGEECPIWTFNGNMQKPTFQPSHKTTWGNRKTGESSICHLYVTDGLIQYLDDCTHSLRGKTVPMTEG